MREGGRTESRSVCMPACEYVFSGLTGLWWKPAGWTEGGENG